MTRKKKAGDIQVGDRIYLPKQRKVVTVTQISDGIWKGDVSISWAEGHTILAGNEEVTLH